MKPRILSIIFIGLGIFIIFGSPIIIQSSTGITSVSLSGLLGVLLGVLLLASGFGLWSKKEWRWKLTIFTGIVLIGYPFRGIFLILKTNWLTPLIDGISVLLYAGLGLSTLFHLKQNNPSHFKISSFFEFFSFYAF